MIHYSPPMTWKIFLEFLLLLTIYMLYLVRCLGIVFQNVASLFSYQYVRDGTIFRVYLNLCVIWNVLVVYYLIIRFYVSLPAFPSVQNFLYPILVSAVKDLYIYHWQTFASIFLSLMAPTTQRYTEICHRYSIIHFMWIIFCQQKTRNCKIGWIILKVILLFKKKERERKRERGGRTVINNIAITDIGSNFLSICSDIFSEKVK